MDLGNEIAEVFGGVRIFAGLNREAIQTLSEAAAPVPFQAGVTLVHKDSPGNTIFLIASGQVKVFDRGEDGTEVVFAHLGAYDYFGEMAIIESRPRSAWVQATEPGVAVTLRSSDMLHLFQRMPEQYAILILNIARDLSRRIAEFDQAFAHRAGHIHPETSGAPLVNSPPEPGS